jgi:exosortase
MQVSITAALAAATNRPKSDDFLSPNLFLDLISDRATNLPIAHINRSSRLTHRIHFRVREGFASTTTLVDGARSLGIWNGPSVQGPFTVTSRTGTVGSLLLLSALVLVLYGRVLGNMALQWWSDPNYGHGFLVPVFAAYILWRERSRRRAVPIQSNNWGLLIMLFAIGLLILGTLGSEHFTARISMLFLISGIIVFLVGWRALRSVAFPMGYLVLMIPLPAIVYYQLTFPLQLLASRLGANGLVALGVPTVREGNLLILPNVTLEVVEACSGVRSLLSLVAVVVGYVYLAEPSTWKRCVLVATTVPIVIVSNGLRLVATGVLSSFFGPKADTGLAHTGLGLVFFALAFLSILLIHRLLRHFTGKQIPASAH